MKLDHHVHRRRRRPGEVLGLRATVRANCLQCVGWNAAEVARCSSHACWCWPWRMPGRPNLEGEDPSLMARQYYDPAQERTGNPTEPPAKRLRSPEQHAGATKRRQEVP